MTTHELKTWPEHFAAVRSCAKVHEIRRDDRDFQKGDVLILREWDPATKKYSGEQIRAEVTHVTRGGQFGLDRDYCVMSIMGLGEVDMSPAQIKESLMRMLDRAKWEADISAERDALAARVRVLTAALETIAGGEPPPREHAAHPIAIVLSAVIKYARAALTPPTDGGGAKEGT